jgi:hypothetical protein
MIAGLLVVLATTSSVLRNLVVPRRLRSKLRLVVSFITSRPFRFIADRSTDYGVRDRVLAWTAPTALLALLLTWLVLYLVGYGLLAYAISSLSLPVALREAGSSLFTLGFASSDRGQLTVVDFAAAITGPVVIGLQIGYLPALYAAYNRREAEVTMLDSRAGEPNWGPEILARHSAISSLDNLSELYRGWERWAADVSESHSNYPVLIYLRSQEPTRNWLIGLLSVMDSAALHLALNPTLAGGEPRMAVRMGFVCMRGLAETMGMAYQSDPDPDSPITLTYEEYLDGIARLERAGYPMERTPQEAWPHFRGWRVNYEAAAYRLAMRLDLPPALWSGPRPRGRPSALPPVRPRDRRPGAAQNGHVPPGAGRPGNGHADPSGAAQHADRPGAR